jgi:hypothetical protein
MTTSALPSSTAARTSERSATDVAPAASAFRNVRSGSGSLCTSGVNVRPSGAKLSLPAEPCVEFLGPAPLRGVRLPPRRFQTFHPDGSMLGRDTLVVGPNLRNAFDHHLTLMLGSLQRPARRLFVAAARVGLPRLTRGGELLHVTAMRSLHGFGECGDRRFAVTQFPFALFKPGEGGTERRRHLDRRNLDHKFPSTVWDCVRIRPHVWRSHRFITAFGSEIGAVVLGPAPRSTGQRTQPLAPRPPKRR